MDLYILGSIAWGLSTDQVWEVGAMTECNIANRDWRNCYYCVYCQRVEEKKKQHHFEMTSLCNDYFLPGQGIIIQCVAFKIALF